MSLGANKQALMGAAGAAGDDGDFYSHQITHSARFQLANTSKMERTPSSSGNRSKWTYSTWVKRTKFNINTSFFGATRSGYENVFRFEDTSGNDQINLFGFTGSSLDFNIQTKASRRDPNAWYHIVIAFDTTQGTSTNRIKLYVNGEQQTTLQVATYPSQNYSSNVNDSSTPMQIGYGSYGGQYFDGYIAESILIDGLQLDASSFGETKNGVWIPKDPSGLTFGTNGFWMNYASSGALGNDVSGNNNDMSTTNLPPHDQMIDTPTNNFPVYSSIYNGNNTVSEGGLESTGGGGEGNSTTFAMSTGKWYWECKAQTVSAYAPTFGIGQSGTGSTNGSQYDIISWQTSAGQLYAGGGYPELMGTITIVQTGVSSLSSGDILSWWLDCDNRKLWIGKNGTIPNSGNPATGANPQASWATNPIVGFNSTCQNVASGVGVFNAGQNPSFNGTETAGTKTDKNGFGLFKYDPSSTDFLATCARNMPVAAAVDPKETADNFPQKLFSPLLYVGNGSDDRNITGVGFAPDWVWMKSRTDAEGHQNWDTSRGVEKRLQQNSSGAEESTSDKFQAFQSDGFQVGSSNDTNKSSSNFVTWNWRVNGGTTSTNSAGSVNVTQQVDPSGGFSISTYSGAGGTGTIGHGLSNPPSFVIVKQRNGANNWTVYHKGVGATKFANLDNTGAFQSASIWQNTTPSSSLVYLGDNNEVNHSGRTYVAYCYANTAGYIATGTYRGNGNDNGPCIITENVKPAWLLIREYGAADNWVLYDNKRLGYNFTSAGNAVLYPDEANAEENQASRALDILANGFKLRTSNATINSNNGQYLYVAMSSNPFSYGTAR